MTAYEQVVKALAPVGIPGALQAYPEGHVPKPPFYVFLKDEGGEIFADDSNWAELPSMQVELYEKERSAELEQKVFDALKAAFGPVATTEAWVETEHVREVVFNFSVAHVA